MKTLVIHPKDKSTDFLIPIYKGMKNKTVVRGGINRGQLIDLIKSHDRVMMMGHGWTYGLFNTGTFDMKELIIDGSMVHLLNQKKENVFIWCRAKVFVNHFKLKGFTTDMFISEVEEAYYFGIIANQKEVDESNNTFVNIFKKYRTKDGATMLKKVKPIYSKLALTNEVAKYNSERLYHF